MVGQILEGHAPSSDHQSQWQLRLDGACHLSQHEGEIAVALPISFSISWASHQPLAMRLRLGALVVVPGQVSQFNQ